MGTTMKETGNELTFELNESVAMKITSLSVQESMSGS